MIRSWKIVFLALAFLTQNRAWGELPRLENLNIVGNPIFSQFERILSSNYQRIARGENPSPPLIFVYKVKPHDDLFSIAAQTNLPYDTLATLNDLGSGTSLSPEQELLIPTVPGIYVPEDLSTYFSKIRSAMDTTSAIRFFITQHRGPQAWWVYPKERFHSLERAYFLGILFRFPLEDARMTSSFGPRSDPFTGHPSFHNGIDLAAPRGTPVKSAREGMVLQAGYDRIYGNFVVIDHGSGYQTLYGHLEKILVDLNQSVGLATILGEVGSTGYSTGPHLHFEILRGGSPVDPGTLLPLEN